MPEALARNLIVSFSKLDPFAGVGTTPKMAMLNGRRWLGFEIDPEWVAIACDRLRESQRRLWAA